jgi:hypothetical protein
MDFILIQLHYKNNTELVYREMFRVSIIQSVRELKRLWDSIPAGGSYFAFLHQVQDDSEGIKGLEREADSLFHPVSTLSSRYLRCLVCLNELIIGVRLT